MVTRRRVRRTPEQAREEILAAARARLSAQGIEGLRIADIAADVNMSHATLLHHFGSSEEMRAALLARMGSDLLDELLNMLEVAGFTAEHRAASLRKIFGVLGDPRHAQLFAWLAVQPVTDRARGQANLQPTAELFGRLLDRMQLVMPLAQAQFAVTLVVTAAVGFGVTRGWLGDFGLPADDEALQRFVDAIDRLLPLPNAG